MTSHIGTKYEATRRSTATRRSRARSSRRSRACSRRTTTAAESGALLAKIEGMLEAYNYSENDWQSEYSRCRFYGDVKIAGEIEQAERAAHEQLAAMGDVRAILGDAAQLGVLSVNMVETRDVMDWRGREVLIPATAVAEAAIRVLRAERVMLDAAS